MQRPSLSIEKFEQRLALTSFTADLDGLEPLEQVTISNDNRVMVVSGSSQKTYTIGTWNDYKIGDLDGMPGHELVFYWKETEAKLRSDAYVITHRTQRLSNYDVGFSNVAVLSDLDGEQGSEILFYTDRTRFYGGGPIDPILYSEQHPHLPFIVTARTMTVDSYLVPEYERVADTDYGVTIAELDGVPGYEVMFFPSYRPIGRNPGGSFQQVGVSILSPRSGVSNYDTGQITRSDAGFLQFSELLQLDGIAGLEIVITLPNGDKKAIFHGSGNVQPLTVYRVSNTQDFGAGSLRQAILNANASNSNTNFIVFDLPSGESQIRPVTPLPSILRTVTIVGAKGDGLPGVELNGESAGGNANGFTIAGDNVVIRGFVINRFRGSGIRIQGGSNNWLSGNYIGTDSRGNDGLGNSGTGVTIDGTAVNNRVGTNGDGQNDFVERNVISGNGQWGVLIDGANASGNAVAGNFIGTNATGTSAIGNGWWGVAVSGPDNLIGGSGVAGKGNVVSGNRQGGITVLNRTAIGNRIQGNYIGTNAAGDRALGNAFSGILVADWGVAGQGPTNTLVGGSEVGMGNVVSANGNQGIWIGGSTTTGTVIAGNRIGTNAAGTDRLGNAFSGLLVSSAASQTLVGTNADGIGDLFERNIVSGNGGAGIDFSDVGPGSSVVGNFVGTNLNGTAAIGNLQDGVRITAGSVGSRIGTNGDGVNDGAEMNVISGNGGDGVQIRDVGTNNNVVAGNYVGTDVSGTRDLGNGLSGIAVFGGPTNTRIGTDNSNDAFNSSERNVVGFNGAGVFIADANTVGTTVAGNYLGVAPSGNAAIPNNDGVYLYAAVNTHISNNILSGNDGSGLYLRGSVFAGGVGGTGTVLTGNFIGTNATGTAVLSNRGWGMLLDAGIKGTRIGSDGDGVNDKAEQNIISGNGRDGIAIGVRESDDTIIRGNYIGTDVSGTLDFGNRGSGVLLAEWFYSPTSEGAPKRAVIEANLISGNDSTGITITGNGSDSHRISGNRIGTNATGLVGLPNGTGILVTYGAKDNIIGTNGDGVNDSSERNIISGNGDIGVLIQDAGTDGNVIAGNYIGVGVDGLTPVPNLGNSGVYVWQSAKRTRIGTDGTSIGDLAERNVISGNSQEGITIDGVGTDNTIIAGNHIGVSANGMEDVGNGFAGVYVVAGPANTRIGTNGDGSGDVAERNIISGNENGGIAVADAATTDTVIAGNWIGIDASGASPVPNSNSAILVFSSTGTRIGTNGDGVGDTTERNVISGNAHSGIGILLGANGSIIAGNYIGTNATGDRAIGNGDAGVYISGTNGLVIGTNGDGNGDASEGNLISGNGWDGIRFADTSTNGIVAGNLVGTDASGLIAIPNLLAGVAVHPGNRRIRIGTNADGVSDSIERNIVSGNAREGIFVAGDSFAPGAVTEHVVITGNYVGVNINGTSALGNGLVGVNINAGAKNTRVGTNGDGVNDSVERNVISASGNDGVLVRDAGTNGTVIAGNYVGTDVTGTIDLGNVYSGVAVWGGPANTRIGTDNSPDAFNDTERNVISGNNSFGTYTADAATRNTLIAGNYIGVNATGNARLKNDSDGIFVYASVDTKIRSNVVSGNNGIGMYIRGALFAGGVGGTGTEISGNKIGTNASGTAIVGNGSRGIQIDAGSKGTLVGSNGDGVNDVQERNIISGNGLEGIAVGTRQTDDTIIRGNYIGTDVTGNLDFGNVGDGVTLREWYYSPMSEGSPKRAVVERNIISGNDGLGISIVGAGSDSHRVSENKIGTNFAGTHAIANAGGIGVFGGSKGNIIGTNNDGFSDTDEGNQISGNLDYGIRIDGYGTNNNIISCNLIGTNASATSAIRNGGSGVLVTGGARNTQIGSDTFGVLGGVERNVISGNRYSGVVVYGDGTDGTIVVGNNIGVGLNGFTVSNLLDAGVVVGNFASNTLLSGNQIKRNFGGVFVDGTSSNTSVVGNAIEFNVGNGLRVAAQSNPSIFVRYNNFYGNDFGVDLGSVGVTLNDLDDTDGIRNAPVVTSSRIRNGVLVLEGFARAGTTFDLHASAEYTNGYGQGDTFVKTFVEGSLEDLASNAAMYGPSVNGITVGSDLANRFKFEVQLADLPSWIIAGINLTAVSIGPNSEFSSLSKIVIADVTSPLSSVAPLPLSATSLSIPIVVSGTDPAGPEGPASGIMEYDLYVAVDSGPFTKFATVPSSSPAAQFAAESNHVYFFRSVARDRHGNEEINTGADAFTRVGDLDPPATQVVSAAPESDGFITLNASGTDTGGGRLASVNFYVSIDGAEATLIGESNAVAGSASIRFQGIADGQSHTYRFYSRGRDTAGNLEATPISSDISLTVTFAAPGELRGVGIDVQLGATQRSYIRYVDVLFNSASGVADLTQPNRIRVEKFSLNASDVTPGTGSSIAASLAQVGSTGRMRLDFGTQGLGGNSNTTAGDGFYRIRVDANNDGDFSDPGESFEFYRLLGDSNGDTVVDSLDTAVVDNFFGLTGPNLDADLNGDGVVNSADRGFTLSRFRGRRLSDTLRGFIDD